MRKRCLCSSASRLREVHEVYNTIHGASMRHLASYGKLHNECDPINIAIHFYINFDVEVWAPCSASSDEKREVLGICLSFFSQRSGYIFLFRTVFSVAAFDWGCN